MQKGIRRRQSVTEIQGREEIAVAWMVMVKKTIQRVLSLLLSTFAHGKMAEQTCRTEKALTTRRRSLALSFSARSPSARAKARRMDCNLHDVHAKRFDTRVSARQQQKRRVPLARVGLPRPDSTKRRVSVYKAR